ncbi:outer membrane adhesin opca [Lucifera butyrica]|uniref:Outer membrane adhesin opca n=1 Tax=Lucifera butyrica TaxID=1351585 RepID=A0A498R8D2_9FIRM|nr:hypothetical protein [Lucifera butyrica]VBB06532.1 outer membrane adhesin opca [Lucifera butyrica]
MTYQKNFWKISYDNTNGNTQYEYNGAVGGPPDKSTTNSNFSNFEVTYGIPISDDNKQFIYTGYGYHTWDRSLATDALYSGYLEKYSWSYIPVGYRIEYKINNQWDGALDIAAKFTFKGKLGTYYNGGSTDVGQNFNLGNKPGIRVEAPFTDKLDTQWSFVLTPWYEYSAINQSNILADGSYEPDSQTHQYGVNLGFSYIF